MRVCLVNLEQVLKARLVKQQRAHVVRLIFSRQVVSLKKLLGS